jgi:uncharacterized protein with HEPN domain
MKRKAMVDKIIVCIDKISLYCAEHSYEEFRANQQLVEACVFNLSQIGELANKIDDDFKNSQSAVPWKKLYGLRNRIIHDYEGVNFLLIWEIIKNDLPSLKEQLVTLNQ